MSGYKAGMLHCRGCGRKWHDVATSSVYYVECSCGQFVAFTEATRPVDNKCPACKWAIEDHRWVGDLAHCIKEEKK